MFKRCRLCLLILLAGLIGAAIGGGYSLLTKPVYEAVTSVVLYRDRIENPNSVSEEGKNRWDWVRDGLTLTEGLLSDDALMAMVRVQPLLETRYEAFKAKLVKRHHLESAPENQDMALPMFLQKLRNHIRIEYTGGDSNTFTFHVKDESAEVAKSLSQAMIERLKQVWVTSLRQSYSEVLAALGEEEGKAGIESTSLKSRAYLRNSYNSILVASKLNEVMAERNFQVIKRPSLPVAPIWPRLCLLLVVGAVGGILAGLFVTYLRCTSQECAAGKTA